MNAFTLSLVKANGFSVVTDAGCAGEDGDLHLISLLGRKAAVEAVGAACLVGQGAVVYPDPQLPGFDAHAPAAWAWRMFTAHRPGGEAQMVLVPQRADLTRVQTGAFTILAPLDSGPEEDAAAECPSAGPEDELARLHYLFLSRAVATPLEAGWAGWLWRRAGECDEVTALRCWGSLPAAYTCHPDEAVLRDDLLAALRGDMRYGRLPRPTVRTSTPARLAPSLPIPTPLSAPTPAAAAS